MQKKVSEIHFFNYRVHNYFLINIHIKATKLQMVNNTSNQFKVPLCKLHI